MTFKDGEEFHFDHEGYVDSSGEWVWYFEYEDEDEDEGYLHEEDA